MITGPLIAEIAGLVGEPARATMLSALLDGRALTATELAYAARVTPQTASTHLAKLAEAGLVARIRDGRYRYFRLASPTVAQMLDGIMAVALEHRPRYRPLSRRARELSAARICYDHLAGRLSVDLADSLITHDYIVVGDEAAEITPAGTRFLKRFGIDLSALSARGRHFCRLCIDWTERRPHIAGAVGAALTKRCFDLGWTERMKHSSAVMVTASGKHGFEWEASSAVWHSPRRGGHPEGPAFDHPPLRRARAPAAAVPFSCAHTCGKPRTSILMSWASRLPMTVNAGSASGPLSAAYVEAAWPRVSVG
jgi:DNA-binding transcriptional ArsR family regulator